MKKKLSMNDFINIYYHNDFSDEKSIEKIFELNLSSQMRKKEKSHLKYCMNIMI